MSDYRTFLTSKHCRPARVGFDVAEADITPALHDWQKAITKWALRCGRAALFEDCGLGKTLQQLEFARQVCLHTGGNVILLCPLAVQWQTLREAQRFGITDSVGVNIVATQSDVKYGISIANYEKLSHFDTSTFEGVVLDESSVLKAYTGTTKRWLCKLFSETRFKLACTATPAPNDRLELGNHADFLGIMPSNEMIARWFINDGGKCGNYRLRKHGASDFWRWMASWSVCISTPSDIGYSDDGYVLPPLNVVEHVIECKAADGFLFALPTAISATNVHKEKRLYLGERADVVAGLVNGDTDPWAVWCDTDYEADALCERIPDAVEVRGSHSPEIKEDRLRSFSEGRCRVMVTKSEIGGFGLNWQHCHKTTWFAGYSYERFYQAIRRLLRFGQLHPVDCHLVRTVSEGSIAETIDRKKRQHIEMQREMAGEMAEGMREELGYINRPREYLANVPMMVPAWCGSH